MDEDFNDAFDDAGFDVSPTPEPAQVGMASVDEGDAFNEILFNRSISNLKSLNIKVDSTLNFEIMFLRKSKYSSVGLSTTI